MTVTASFHKLGKANLSYDCLVPACREKEEEEEGGGGAGADPGKRREPREPPGKFARAATGAAGSQDGTPSVLQGLPSTPT